MKQLVAVSISTLLFLSSFAHAGVVMDMVTKDASGQETDRSKIQAQAEMIRMDQVGGNDATSMIFRGHELLYVNHGDKSYIVMDEAMLEKVSTKMSEATKQMEAQLARMSPDERAMMERMMKGRMPPGMAGQKSAPRQAPRVESMGSSKWQSYKCQQYAIYKGAEKTQEVCAADLDDVDGAEEAIETFRNMAAYMTKMTESLPMRSADGMNPGELMDQIDGFPVHTIDYKNGVVTGETSLDSVTEQDLGKDLFDAPEGYVREDPFVGR